MNLQVQAQTQAMPISRKVRVRNSAGLHARPCGAVVSAALEFQSSLRLKIQDREVDGKSILHLMTLGAGQNSEIELIAEGEDAVAMLDCIEALFESGFGED